MVCSICSCKGHNKRTCPTQRAARLPTSTFAEWVDRGVGEWMDNLSIPFVPIIDLTSDSIVTTTKPSSVEVEIGLLQLVFDLPPEAVRLITRFVFCNHLPIPTSIPFRYIEVEGDDYNRNCYYMGLSHHQMENLAAYKDAATGYPKSKEGREILRHHCESDIAHTRWMYLKLLGIPHYAHSDQPSKEEMDTLISQMDANGWKPRQFYVDLEAGRKNSYNKAKWAVGGERATDNPKRNTKECKSLNAYFGAVCYTLDGRFGKEHPCDIYPLDRLTQELQTRHRDRILCYTRHRYNQQRVEYTKIKEGWGKKTDTFYNV